MELESFADETHANTMSSLSSGGEKEGSSFFASPNNVKINTVKSSGSLARSSFDARRSICPHRPKKKKKKLHLLAKSASSIDLGFEWSSGWTNSSSGDRFIFTA